MYTVTIYKHQKAVNGFIFGTENKAISCLVAHASHKDLNISDDYYYASSEGNKPEIEIEILQIADEK